MVQQRIGTTMAYFSGACCTTGAMMYALRNSSRALSMNPWLLLGLSFGTMFATHSVDYERNWVLKNMLYGGFIGTISLSLVPLIHMYSMPIIYDACIATSMTIGSLGVVAYNSPSEQFLKMGGPLALGMGGLMGVSLLSILYPGSPALTNIWMYGGLALFSMYVLHDTQRIMYNAKTQKQFDPIVNSIHVYMDAVNIFVRMVMLLGNSKKK
jgi:growth hormone-inducible transmembrane protein